MFGAGGSRKSSISPFRSRKSLVLAKSVGRPRTPSIASSSRPPSRLSASPAASASPSPNPNPSPSSPTPPLDRPKENVLVTVRRFRPLSRREINKGVEIAWYADVDFTVRNECNPSTAYGFDRVFGPATTTQHVYDVAAQHACCRWSHARHKL